MATPTPEQDQIADYLNNAPDSFLTCRELGHAWEPEHRGWLTEGTGRNKQYTKRLSCLRCTMARVDTCDPTDFMVTNRRYEHPEGYLVHGAHISKYDVRRFSIEQSTTVTELPKQRRASSRTKGRARRAA